MMTRLIWGLIVICPLVFDSVNAFASEEQAVTAVSEVAPGKVLSVTTVKGQPDVWSIRVLTDKGRVVTYLWSEARGVHQAGQ